MHVCIYSLAWAESTIIFGQGGFATENTEGTQLRNDPNGTAYYRAVLHASPRAKPKYRQAIAALSTSSLIVPMQSANPAAITGVCWVLFA